MSHKGLEFKSIRKPYIYLLEGRRMASFSPLQRNIVKAGNDFRIKKTDKGLLEISQPIGYIVKDDADALRIKDEIAAWLVTKDWARLSFDNEPGRSYLAVVQNSIDDFDRFVDQRSGTIQFIAKATLGEEKTIPVTTTRTMHTITGQDNTPWIVEVTFTEATSIFELQASNGLYLLLQYEFIEGDRLTIKYEGREVLLNGNDLRRAVRLKTNYELLEPGMIGVSGSHACEIFYNERYY